MKALAKLILGADCDVDAIWHSRHNKEMDVPLPMSSDMLIASSACFEEADLQEVSKVLDVEREPDHPAKHAETSKPGDGSSSGSSSKAASRLKKPLGGGSSWETAEIRRLCPPGCQVSREQTWHSRWRVHNPSWPEPKGTSACWGHKLSEKQAVDKVLKWAWARAQRLGKVADCPYAFDS